MTIDQFNNSTFAKNFQIEVIEMKDGYARLSMQVDDTMLNVHDMVHGGFLFTLADTTAGAACMSRGHECVTLNGNINYVKPATGPIVYAEAKEIHNGRTTAVYEIDVLDHAHGLLATATFTMYILKRR